MWCMLWVGVLFLASYQEDRARLFTVLRGRKVKGNGPVLKQGLHMGVKINFTMKTGLPTEAVQPWRASATSSDLSFSMIPCIWYMWW